MQKLIFFLICTLLLIKPSANGIFLSTLGVERLPYAFLGVAFAAFFVTSIYAKYISVLPPKILFIRSTLVSIVILVVLGVFMWFSWAKEVSAFLFYLFMSIFGILSASQFWIMANQLFNAREARKYFGIIGLGAIGGGITGGYLASVVSAFLQSEILLFIAAGFLLFSLRYIQKIQVDKSSVITGKSTIKGESSILHPFRLIKKSKHLKYLAIILALSVFVAKMIDYQFGYFATNTFSQEEELTAYFGFWYSSFNLISFLIQIFLTTRVVGRFGVGFSLLILPFILLINISLLLIIPVLLFALLMKLTDASLKQSINKAALELMMLPIPDDIKLRTKTFLDVFIDSLATGISGIILLFVLNAFDLPNYVVTIVILIAVIAWVAYANKMRKEYKSVFRQSLRIQSSKNAKKPQSVYQDYEKILLNGSDSQIIKALKLLKDQPIEGIKHIIPDLLKSDKSNIVLAVLETIMYKLEDFSDEVIQLLKTGDQNVKISAFEYLINHQQRLKPEYLINFLNSKDSEVQLTAIAAFAKEFQNDVRTLQVLRLSDRLGEIIKYSDDPAKGDTHSTILLLKSISYGKFSEHYSFIDKLLISDDAQLRHHAFLAAGETKSSKYLKYLVNELDKDPPKSIFLSLSKFGSRRLKTVIDNLIKKVELNKLRRISRVLELIPDQLSIYLLQVLSETEDLNARNHAISSLCHLRDKYPLLTIDENLINNLLLEEARYSNELLNILLTEKIPESKNESHKNELIRILKKKIDGNLGVIFNLLHIIYPPEEYLELYDYVIGPDQTLRNNAIEYLESTLGNDIKKSIIPLLDYQINKLTAKPALDNSKSFEAMKDFLIQNRDDEIKNAALNFFKN